MATDDIVTRLREVADNRTAEYIMIEALGCIEELRDENEILRDEIERLRKIIKTYVEVERGYAIKDDNLKLFINEHAQSIAWREAWIDLANEADRD